MHRAPYKPTFMGRITVSQEARVVVPPELEAPPGSYRKVQIVLPNSPATLIGLDVEPQKIGPNRTYKLAEMNSSPPLIFDLLPHQFITMASKDGMSYASVVIQYRAGEL